MAGLSTLTAAMEGIEASVLRRAQPAGDGAAAANPRQRGSHGRAAGLHAALARRLWAPPTRRCDGPLKAARRASATSHQPWVHLPDMVVSYILHVYMWNKGVTESFTE